jgi:uncharacterized protein (TIGR02466 family)
MEVIEVFKVPILSKKLEVDNEKIVSESLRLKEKHKGRIFSNVGGWQSDSFIDNEFFSDLLNEVNNTCFDFSNSLGIMIEGKTEYWININQYMHFNRPHIHPGSVFSAVYYAKYPNNCGQIGFSNPADNIGYDWSNKVKSNNCYNSAEFNIIPQEGFLLVFPSWLEHYVSPNENKNEDRISIAFNVN